LSVALRLTLWYVASLFVIILVATGALYMILVGNLRREEDHFLSEKVQVLRELLRNRPGDMFELKEEVEQTWAPMQYAQVYARVMTGKGKVVVESPKMGELAAHQFPAAAGSQDQPAPGVILRGTSGKEVRGMSARAEVGRAGDRQFVIQVALDTQVERDVLAGYRRQLLLLLLIGLPVCAVVGYWLAHRSLRPLREISATAQRIRSSNLDERIDPARLPAELSSLAERFNAMLDRLKDSFARLSRFSADIAHELRTPVNNLRMEMEVSLNQGRTVGEYRETLGSCLEECERLSRIIDSLLFIARAEDPRTQVKKEPVDVERELDRVREFYEAPASEAGVELVIRAEPNVSAPLDRTLFQRAVSNLVANAIRHTPRDGTVTVSAGRENGRLLVEVSDTGAGIATEDLPHIFDRFYRADQSRANAGGNLGLGLAIVKSIVTLHGGSVAVHSGPQEGTRMTLQFPAAAEPAFTPDRG
jgi:two-component system heavy metal sensor histidine kinase CusS